MFGRIFLSMWSVGQLLWAILGPQTSFRPQLLGGSTTTTMLWSHIPNMPQEDVGNYLGRNLKFLGHFRLLEPDASCRGPARDVESPDATASASDGNGRSPRSTLDQP